MEIIAEDPAGNQSTVKTSATTLNNTPPRFTVQGKATVTGNTSMSITATATDDQQDTLTYTLRYSTSQSNLDTTTTTKTATKAKGQQVTFNLTATDGISNYTTYYFRVDVSDGIAETVKGNPGQARTWCGLATSCSGKVSSSVKCSECDGKRRCKWN